MVITLVLLGGENKHSEAGRLTGVGKKASYIDLALAA